MAMQRLSANGGLFALHAGHYLDIYQHEIFLRFHGTFSDERTAIEVRGDDGWSTPTSLRGLMKYTIRRAGLYGLL